MASRGRWPCRQATFWTLRNPRRRLPSAHHPRESDPRDIARGHRAPGATRSHAQGTDRRSVREHGEDGEDAPLPKAETRRYTGPVMGWTEADEHGAASPVHSGGRRSTPPGRARRRPAPGGPEGGRRPVPPEGRTEAEWPTPQGPRCPAGAGAQIGRPSSPRPVPCWSPAANARSLPIAARAPLPSPAPSRGSRR